MKTAKAVVAAATTLLGTVGTVIADGHVDATEVGVVVTAVIVAYGAVFKVPNRSAPDEGLFGP
jgi:hypothetical protein